MASYITNYKIYVRDNELVMEEIGEDGLMRVTVGEYVTLPTEVFQQLKAQLSLYDMLLSGVTLSSN